MKNKRVLIVGQHYWPETFRITDIAEGLVENGYDVDVLCGIPNYPAGKFFSGYGIFKKRTQLINGVRVMRVLEIPRGNNTNFRIFINFISFPFFAMFHIPRLLFTKYDRVVAYQLSPVFMSLPAIIISKIKRIPLYFYVCDFWPHSLFSMIDFSKQPLLKRIITRVSYWHYKKADGIIGVFKGMQTRFITEVGMAKEKTLYIPQAPEKIYETEVYDKELEKRFAKTFNIVFAGNINPAQSFDVITQAALNVYNAGHKDINYIIIGEGMSKKWLIKEVQRLGIASQFTFEGLKPVTDIPKYQTVADALIVGLSKSPLFEYGIPAKIYSYLPSGKPIIAAIDGEGGNIINSIGAGIAVDSGDVEGLTSAIIDIKEMDKDKRLKMGKKGKAYYFKHFEREKNLQRLIEFVFNNNRIIDKEYPDTL